MLLCFRKNMSPIIAPYFYVAIGFLSGFSERFTRGLLDNGPPALGDAAADKTAK